MNTAAIRGHLREVGRNGLGAPILLLLMLAMMVLPLPAAFLDLLFTFNISLALVVLLAGVYARRPLDFSSFPTILLLVTLMRLALNVASTRVVLLEGHTGSDAAGKVIQAFGENGAYQRCEEKALPGLWFSDPACSYSRQSKFSPYRLPDNPVWGHGGKGGNFS